VPAQQANALFLLAQQTVGALLELMILSVLSVEELISLAFERPHVLERIPRSCALVATGSHP